MSNYIDNINSERLLWCLESFGYDLENYPQAISISKDKLAAAKLTYKQLKKFASYFGYSILFFLEKSKPDIKKVHSLAFRTLQNQKILFDEKTSKLIKHIEKTRDNYLTVLEDIGEEFRFCMPNLTGSIEEKALAVRDWLKIDQASKDSTLSFSEYRHLIEDKNILVFQSMGYNGKWKIHNDMLFGLSIYDPVAPVIFVRKITNNEKRQVFTLFHELAHILLHNKTLIDDENNLDTPQEKQEIEANRFAGLCLLPSYILQNIQQPVFKDDCLSDEITDLTKKYGISKEVVLRRLLDEKKITSKCYENYIQQQKTEYANQPQETKPLSIPRSYRYREPLHIYGSNYTANVIAGLEEGKISLNKASDYLDGIKISDLKKLEGDLYGK